MAITRRQRLEAAAVGGVAAALPGTALARPRASAEATSVGMLYDTTRCIGCRTCVTKCKEANSLPPDRRDLNGAPYDAPADLNGTTKNVIKLAGPAEHPTFMKAQCNHCVDPACASVCMIGALRKNPATGIVTYDVDGCVGCRYCQVACPFNVPKFNWDKPVPRIVKCELCRHRADPKKSGPLAVANPACCEVCPRDAVIYGERAALLAEAKARIARSPDRYQPRVYGEKEAGGTQVLYLTARDVPFESLGLPAVGDEPAPELSESIQHGIYYGMLAPAAVFAAALTRTMKTAKAAPGEEEG